MDGIVQAGVFELDPIEWVGWALQLSLIGWLLWRRPSSVPLPPLATTTCVLILAAGWIWRLAHGFSLAADDFGFWIGDDVLRFVRAWEWSQAPFLARERDPWIAGSYYLHGSAMWLLGGIPIHASKLVSATYAVLPLVGVFLFAQSVFERREISALAVVLVAPWWIDVMLGTGLMTELPVTGLLLTGVACLVWGLREPLGRRRTGLHAAGALALAAATSLHLVAWIYLAVIQAGLLCARLAGRGPARLPEWTLTAAGSGLFCVVWSIAQWQVTGDALTQVAKASADSTRYKLFASAGENAAIYPIAVFYSLRYLAPLALFGVVAPFLGRSAATPSRWLLAGIGAALSLLMGIAVLGGTNITPFRTVAPLAAMLAAFATAALFPRAGSSLRWPRPALICAAGIALLGFADGHAKVLDNRVVRFWDGDSNRIPLSNLFVAGRWVGETLRERDAAGDTPPVRVLWPNPRSAAWAVFAHAVGRPGMLEPLPRAQLLSHLRPGQLVVSSHRLPRQGLVPIAEVAGYFVYEARDGARGRAR